MERLTHKQVQELLGAYALDAVDADEAEIVELHLRNCPRCRAEVEAHREAAALLAHVGAPAPEGVWDRITEQLEAEAPPFESTVGLATAGIEGRDGPTRGRSVGGEAAGAAGAAGGLASVGAAGAAGAAGSVGAAGAAGSAGTARGEGMPAAPPSAGRRSGSGGDDGESTGMGRILAMPARFVGAALAAAAVLVVLLGVQVVRLDTRLDDMTSAVQQRSVDQAALAAMADPEARRVQLRSDDGAQEVRAVLLPDGQAYLVPERLSALSADQTYQLWAVVGSEKISVGVLGSNPGVVAFRYSGEPSALAVTAERAGGVIASEKTPVVVGAVPPVPA